MYTNEEKTRTFIGVVITAGQETLTQIARRLDQVLEDFKLPPFYEVKKSFEENMCLRKCCYWTLVCLKITFL